MSTGYVEDSDFDPAGDFHFKLDRAAPDQRVRRDTDRTDRRTLRACYNVRLRLVIARRGKCAPQPQKCSIAEVS